MTRIETETLALLYIVWASALAAEDINIFIVVHSVRIGPLAFEIGVVAVVVGKKLK